MASRGTEVGVEEARRIAIRAQALDGSATTVLETVRRLGFLQLDPIATVATPQELVLWSRLGAFDRGELDRLLWEERALFEWNAFIWPIESLPMVRGLMSRWRTSTHYEHERWGHAFIAENQSFRRYILKELSRRGPLLSRELEDKAAGPVARPPLVREPPRRPDAHPPAPAWRDRDHRTPRQAAAVGSRRALVSTDQGALPRAGQPRLDEQRFRALGVRLEKGRLLAHPDATDGPIADRVTLLSPFDRLIHDRDRTEALWDFFYRLEMYVTPAKREYGYYVLPLLAGDRLVGRAEPVVDRKTGTMRLLGAWGDTSRLDEATGPLAGFLGVEPPPLPG